MDIKDVSTSHITFHPPRISQKRGIIHIVASNDKIVDEFDFDWFPVNRAQTILYVYSGDISKLEIATDPKGRYEIAKLPLNLQCLRMELTLYPIPTKPIQIHDPSAVANIHGFCPNYIVSCWFYENPLAEPCLYMATDSYLPKS